MDIWYLTSEIFPQDKGGIATYIENITKKMILKNHNVKIFVRSDERSSRISDFDNKREVIKFQHMIPKYYDYLGYWTALSYQYCEEVLNEIDKTKSPDIIEVQDYCAIGYYVLTKKLLGDKRLKDTKVIVHLHTPLFELMKVNQMPRFKFPEYWIGQMEKFCLKAADGLVTQSEFLKSKILKEFPELEIEVISLPYEEKSVDHNESSLKSNEILYIGRMEYRKGIFQALKEIKILWDKGKQIKVKIIGGDTYFFPKDKNISQLIKESFHEYIQDGRLIIQDAVTLDELELEILKSKVVLIPSIYENYPNTCIMSMYLKSIVLVSKQGGQSEMVENDGENGFIFDWEKGNLNQKLLEILSLEKSKIDFVRCNAFTRIKLITDVDDNYKKRISFYKNIMKKENKKCFPFVNKLIKKEHLFDENYKETQGMLSIVIPYYNLGDYILEALESLNNIDYKNYEIIIVNDGSNDIKSVEILKKIDSEKIKIINIENRGLANARNVGAKKAQGEYLTFLDADDQVYKTFYSKAINILEKFNNVSFVYSWLEYFEGTKGVWPNFHTEFPYLLLSNMLSATTVVRKKDFLNFGINKVEMEYGMEDYECWISLCENGYFGISIPEVLAKYRIRKDSMARQFNKNMIFYLKDRMSGFHSKLYKEYGVEIYNILYENGPGYMWDNPSQKFPSIGYIYEKNKNMLIENEREEFNELKRIAGSAKGRKILKLFFKLKINRFF